MTKAICIPEIIKCTWCVFASCFTPVPSIIPAKQRKFSKIHLINTGIKHTYAIIFLENSTNN